MKTKKCTECGKVLNIDMFYKKSESGDGVTTQCRNCIKKKIKKYSKKNKITDRETGDWMTGGLDAIYY